MCVRNFKWIQFSCYTNFFLHNFWVGLVKVNLICVHFKIMDILRNFKKGLKKRKGQQLALPPPEPPPVMPRPQVTATPPSLHRQFRSETDNFYKRRTICGENGLLVLSQDINNRGKNFKQQDVVTKYDLCLVIRQKNDLNWRKLNFP